MKVLLYRCSGMLLVFWILFIFLLCSTPGQYIPEFGWMALLGFDKWVHAGIFFVLCVLFFLFAFKRQQGKIFLIVYVAIAVLYGISLELMQAVWFSNRSFDYLDMLANTFGCLMALALYKGIYRRFVSS